MPKNKKLTNKEICNYIVMIEQKLGTAIGTIGQTISDYIGYNGDKEKFMDHLKEKYNEVPDVREKDKKI